MKLAIQDSKIVNILEDKRVILFLILILFLSSMSVLTYRILCFYKIGEERINFEQNLNNTVKVADLSTKEDIALEEAKVTKKTKVTNREKTMNNEKVVAKNPFKILLKKIEKEKVEDDKIEGNKIKVRNIELLGILNNQFSKVAIIKFGKENSLVQIIKVGEEFAGLILKEIKDDKIVMESQGKNYIYTLGGEEN